MKKFLTLLALAAGLTFSQPVQAAASSTDVDTTPVITLGTSLTDSQKEGTLSVLKGALSDSSSYNTLTVTGSDLVTYLNPSGDNFTSSSGVWSSAAIEKTSSGSGINVQILNYNGKNNITTITANQYRNAAITAGITDANIYVTSAVSIDGSGALAGIYKAYAKSGEKLNQKQITAAQDELSTLSGITSENKNKDGYSDAQLNNAVAGAKKEMAKEGSNITKNQIITIVNQQIKNNNLTNVITNEQKNQIVNVLIEIRDSGALNSSSFKQQAGQAMSAIQKSAKGIFSKLNTEENRNALQKLWDAIVNFFTNLFNSFK
ncbi:DUF1002 domain-containing protein [Lactobacillus equicursoris]|uniref:DUF1002 domain-containing protein n=1 Tax=Lactobacillus equicursoris TaxID=420645 RepID=UPI0024328B7B|nr:DUF1002 domain-containing protein [Lactobacillus equicursoris]MDD6386026.1 DUF1002 domain-containing protein [Lactobacillus equicursoris]